MHVKDIVVPARFVERHAASDLLEFSSDHGSVGSHAAGVLATFEIEQFELEAQRDLFKPEREEQRALGHDE